MTLFLNPESECDLSDNYEREQWVVSMANENGNEFFEDGQDNGSL